MSEAPSIICCIHSPMCTVNICEIDIDDLKEQFRFKCFGGKMFFSHRFLTILFLQYEKRFTYIQVHIKMKAIKSQSILPDCTAVLAQWDFVVLS